MTVLRYDENYRPPFRDLEINLLRLIKDYDDKNFETQN